MNHRATMSRSNPCPAIPARRRKRRESTQHRINASAERSIHDRRKLLICRESPNRFLREPELTVDLDLEDAAVAFDELDLVITAGREPIPRTEGFRLVVFSACSIRFGSSSRSPSLRVPFVTSADRDRRLITACTAPTKRGLAEHEQEFRGLVLRERSRVHVLENVHPVFRQQLLMRGKELAVLSRTG